MYCYIFKYNAKKTSVMALTQTLEAPHPFIFLSLIYLAMVMIPNCALEMTLCNWIWLIVLLLMITSILWFTWLELTQRLKTKDRYLHSIFFLSLGQTANQTMIAVTTAKPIEMSSTPHQGSLSKPSTAVPSFTGKRDQEGCRGKGEERKGAFETKGQHVLPST